MTKARLLNGTAVDLRPNRAGERLPGADGTPGQGLTGHEAVRRARKWWNRIGRHGTRKSFNLEQLGRKVVAASGGAPGLVIAGDMKPVVPSGILEGKPFDKLSEAEAAEIVKQWYAHVWAPQQRRDAERPDMNPNRGGQSGK